MFVMTHEAKQKNAELLRNELHGFHKDMLIGLAVEANRTANTSIQETSAYQAVSSVEKRLAAEGLLTIQPQPTKVIDVLVGSHIMVRQGAGAVMFQHQQFQEWYASYEVERVMTEAMRGNASARQILREDVLNWLSWEESILFGYKLYDERLRKDDDVSSFSSPFLDHCSTASVTCVSPVKPRALAPAGVTSMIRPRTNGPRSLYEGTRHQPKMCGSQRAGIERRPTSSLGAALGGVDGSYTGLLRCN